jgi:hypothetical protein
VTPASRSSGDDVVATSSLHAPELVEPVLGLARRDDVDSRSSRKYGR